METRGFQFNAPAAARLSGVQGPSFGFASGASLVADPGIDIWMKGQQQATENLLSGINIGVRGLTEGFSEKMKYDQEKELLKEKAKQEEQESVNKFLRDVYLAEAKKDPESEKLRDELLQLNVDEKRREKALADFYTPLPEATIVPETGGTPQLGGAPLESIDLPPSDGGTPQLGGAVETQPKAPAASNQRFVEQDIGSGRVALFDRVTGKIVPGTISTKEEAAPGPAPEGYTKEQFTRKTPAGTETYKRAGEGKELTSDMVTKLSQFDSVKMTLDEIKQTMAGIDRGPITGFLREKNPYDVDAQTLNKLVESVVPGLARTVFGEVGVLTDADVRRYKEMVPNMKTEEQIAEALIKMLEKKIDASYKGYISTAKKAGFNVSGFEAAEADAGKTEDGTALYGEIKALRDQVSGLSVVDKNRAEVIRQIAQKTKEYIQKTGQAPKF
jgi:hypothetical protein